MIEYLRNALGFFIQLFPCALLFIAALDEDCLRYKRNSTIKIFGITILLLALFFPKAMNIVYSFQITASQFGNIYMLIAIIIMFIMIQLLSSDVIIKKLLITCLVMFYATTQYIIANFFAVYLPIESSFLSSEVYNSLLFWLFSIETLIMLPPSYLFMKKVVRSHLKESLLYDLKREFKLTIILTLLYFFFLIIVISSNSLLNYGFWGNKVAVLITFSSIVCIIAFALNFWILFYELRRIKEESLIKNQITVQKIQYQKISKEIENSKRVRHDLRHHMRTLQTLINKGKIDEALEYIYTFTEESQEFDEQQYCKNFTINTLLCYYINWAQDEGINCTVTAQCDEISIAPSDLTILLGNCLENAILSCRNTQDKKIILKIGIVGANFAIMLTNSCNEIHPTGIKQINNEFLSVNSFASMRSSGYGLKSIENTAKKYNGVVKCRYDKVSHEFTTRIILNLEVG